MEIKEKIKELERRLNELKASIEEKEDNRPITERVKTFEDAVEILGEEHPFVAQWNAVYTDECSADLLAYLKLRIITAALNNGWEPQFVEGEYRYYPWFDLYTQEEWDIFDEETKKKCITLYGIVNNSVYVPFVRMNSDNAPSYARLCFKTADLARYAGRQFAELYADFYLIRK